MSRSGAISVNGVPATKEYAEEKHGVMRAALVGVVRRRSRQPASHCSMAGRESGECLPELIQRENIDGLFIGRSAWQADKFAANHPHGLPLWREKIGNFKRKNQR